MTDMFIDFLSAWEVVLFLDRLWSLWSVTLLDALVSTAHLFMQWFQLLLQCPHSTFSFVHLFLRNLMVEFCSFALPTQYRWRRRWMVALWVCWNVIRMFLHLYKMPSFLTLFYTSSNSKCRWFSIWIIIGYDLVGSYVIIRQRHGRFCSELSFLSSESQETIMNINSLSKWHLYKYP